MVNHCCRLISTISRYRLGWYTGLICVVTILYWGWLSVEDFVVIFSLPISVSHFTSHFINHTSAVKVNLISYRCEDLVPSFIHVLNRLVHGVMQSCVIRIDRILWSIWILRIDWLTWLTWFFRRNGCRLVLQCNRILLVSGIVMIEDHPVSWVII